MPARLADAKEIHAEYGIPPDKLRRLIRLGVIPKAAAPRFGRRVLIDRQAFERFLAAGGASLDDRREPVATDGAADEGER